MYSGVQPVSHMSAVSQYPIGVIIPTYNRSEVLLSCLRHLERQTMTDFEVVVVDDGSTDSTPKLLEEYQRRTPLHLRCIRQDNGGRAHARNAAISALQAPICLMIGDDIFASPDLVSKHLELHRQRPGIQVAGVGLTHWSESGQTVTKFMHWLVEGGVQFSYNDLLRGVAPNWKYFYTSNLSLKTQMLKENPFSNSFTRYGMEDIELGYRLELQHDLELVFLPDALAYHLHPTDSRQSCARAYDIGSSSRVFHEMWPGSAPPGRNSSLRRSLRYFMGRTPWLLPPLTALAHIVTRAWCPNPLMRVALRYYGVLGYQSHRKRNPSSGR